MPRDKSKQERCTQNWRTKRNYRRIYNRDGQVTANIITVDGVDVEVTEEVFLVYSRMDRRERYLSEDTVAGRILSLEQMGEDEVLLRYVGVEAVPDIETAYLEQEESERFRQLLQRLPDAIASLDASERHLIDTLYIKGISGSEYARMTGVSKMAISKRKRRIIKKLKKFLLE